MKLGHYLLIGAVIGWSVGAQAQLIVSFSSIGGPNFVDDVGIAVPDGNEVRIGYFDGTFDVAANAGNLVSLEGAFHEFGATTTETTFLGSGQIGGSVSAVSSGANSFENQKIYLWAFKTTDAQAPNASFSNVSDYGLFSSTQTNWKFPATASPPGNLTSIFTPEVDQSFHAGILAGSPGSLELATVPEPEFCALVTGLGMLAFAGARRLRGQRA
jgi:hypothetical protein